MIDPQILGALTMRLIDSIEADYGEDSTLVKAMVLVEIEHADDEAEDGRSVTVQWASTEDSPVSKAGLVATALRGLMR